MCLSFPLDLETHGYWLLDHSCLNIGKWKEKNRGYYTVARRYEVYLLVEKIFHNSSDNK